ncbi:MULTISPECIES: DUF7127 family protein [Salinibaculum]|uniref:DUF7127 family protein n=1 Tax=Salinibaculum TaxID=2732368 RepID=UPI0030CF4BE9
MSVKEQLAGRDVDVRRFEYDDATTLAVDFGAEKSTSVDVVGDTVIVVVGDEQYDIELDGDAQAFMKNGVLTIEVKE